MSTTSMEESEKVYLQTSKFDSYDDLLKSVREFYYSKGYGISVRSSKKEKLVILQCDRGGLYRDLRGISSKRKKTTGSRLINCPFKLWGRKGSDGAWIFDVKDISHNHAPSTDISGHPSFRELPPEGIKRVKEMTKAGIPPKTNSVIFASRGPKTNRYNMPLLDIIGVSCFNTSFYSGFAFLEREDEESYSWALSVFKEIIGQDNHVSVIMTDRELALMNGIKKFSQTTTNLLCVWHIVKNVLANCKKYFQRAEEFDIFMSGWSNVVYSTTETLFEENWAEFESMYKEKKDAIEYIKNIWFPWKEKFVSAWTDKYLHLGNRSSSRAEGAHAKLKQYLLVSTGDLWEVKEKICLAVEHEFNEIKVKLASEKIRVPHNCNMPFFRELHYRVSHFALKEIYKQYVLSIDGNI